MFDLRNKVAVVTGGGSGIGKAISESLASQGAKVCIFDLNEETGNETAQGINSNGGSARFIACNVADQRSVKTAFDEVIDKEGQLNLLINNAGIAHIGKAHDTSEEDFDRIYQVNVKGVYNCLHVGIPHMINSGGGSIVNLGSAAANVGLPDRFAYSMSKGAVQTMTYSVAKDYVDQGIRCNAIAPGRVHTPFVDGYIKNNYPGQEKEMFDKLSKTQPIGRMGAPSEIGNLVLFLCSDEAAFITGSNFPIDGGFVTLNT